MDKLREEFEKEIKEWYPLAECIAKERNISICDLYPIEWSLWQASSIPEGCVVVPKEPTEAMLEAYEKYSIAPIGSLSKRGYKAMIEAS